MSNTIKSTVRSAPVDLATATAASNVFMSPFFQVFKTDDMHCYHTQCYHFRRIKLFKVL
jgi:hypothetical protein